MPNVPHTHKQRIEMTAKPTKKEGIPMTNFDYLLSTPPFQPFADAAVSAERILCPLRR